MTPKERPINLTAAEVRNAFAKPIIQVRRVMKSQPYTLRVEGFGYATKHGGFVSLESEHCLNECPCGKPGDRLWVRETWGIEDCGSRVSIKPEAWTQGWPKNRLWFSADDHKPHHFGERPAIHMPRWASRIALEVTEVRVQRLQDISEEDARAEGSYLDRCACMPRRNDRTPLDISFHLHWCHIHGEEFKHLWESIHGPGSWEKNPWVWAIWLRRVEA